MKILFPIGSFYPSAIGGPSNTIYWHSRALKKCGIETTIVTTNNGINGIALNTWLEMDCGRVKYCATKFHYLPARMLLSSLKQLIKTDIVHLTSLFYPPSFLLGCTGLIFKKKIVWSVRGELLKSALEFSSFKKKWILRFIKILPKKNIVFHVTSEEERNATRLVMGPAVSIVQLPNFIELPERIKKDKFEYLLFMGRIHPIKGLENLVGALAKSKKFRLSNYKLLIAGAGEAGYENELKQRVAENGLADKIIFTGSVSGQKKQELYARALVSVLPSFSENFGNVVLESLCQATPVIASTGTPWSILETHGAGTWVSNKEESLAMAIDYFLEMPGATYLKMREQAFNLAVSNFNVTSNIDKWLTVYKNIISK